MVTRVFSARSCTRVTYRATEEVVLSFIYLAVGVRVINFVNYGR